MVALIIFAFTTQRRNILAMRVERLAVAVKKEDGTGGQCGAGV
jgi:hypothetical protein